MTNTKDKFSKEHLLYVRKRKLNAVFISFTQIFILVIFFSAWELAARFGVIDSFLMSSPKNNRNNKGLDKKRRFMETYRYYALRNIFRFYNRNGNRQLCCNIIMVVREPEKNFRTLHHSS